TASGVSKGYDGTTAAVVTLSDNRVPGDTFTDNYTSAAFTDPNAGPAKTVNVSGISVSGTDAGNYALADTATNTTAAITGAASATVLVSSQNPSTNGANVTFTATVTSSVGTPTGSVVFLTNSVVLASIPLVAGVAATNTAALPVGTSTVTAQYPAQANFLASATNLTQLVTGPD